MLPSWDPFAAVSAVGFLVTVFVLQFVAGIVVMRLRAGKEALPSRTNG